MVRKIVFGALTLLLALCLVGCGGKKDAGGDAKKDDAAQKTEVATPEFSADKAILGYAELYALGMSDNTKATGLSEQDAKKIVDEWDEQVFGAFKKFPVSDESAEKLTAIYYARLATDMEISAKVKKEDAEHPVVELMAKPINQEEAAKFATESEDIQAIALALNELHENGVTDEDLKGSEEFQQAVVGVIESYINNIPLHEAKTLDVTCQLAEGSDGKVYWAPEDSVALAKFVTGQ